VRIAPGSGIILPALIADAGERTAKRFIEFLTSTIRNPHTRRAYGRAIADFFAAPAPVFGPLTAADKARF
jgi:hypothetical protein